MFIDELSKWTFTVLHTLCCHLYFDSLFYEVMPPLPPVHFILSDKFQQFYLRTVAHTGVFPSNRTKIDTGEAVLFSIDACKLTSLYLQLRGPFISKKLQPLSQLMPTPNRFRSKVRIQKPHMLSAFSNEPPNQIGSGDTKPAPIYMQIAMRSTAE